MNSVIELLKQMAIDQPEMLEHLLPLSREDVSGYSGVDSKPTQKETDAINVMLEGVLEYQKALKEAKAKTQKSYKARPKGVLTQEVYQDLGQGFVKLLNNLSKNGDRDITVDQNALQNTIEVYGLEQRELDAAVAAYSTMMNWDRAKGSAKGAQALLADRAIKEKEEARERMAVVEEQISKMKSDFRGLVRRLHTHLSHATMLPVDGDEDWMAETTELVEATAALIEEWK